MHTLKSNRWADGSPWNRTNRVKEKKKTKNLMSFARHINQSNERMRCAAFTKQQQTGGINVYVSGGSNQSLIQSNGIHRKKTKNERRTTTKPWWKEREKKNRTKKHFNDEKYERKEIKIRVGAEKIRIPKDNSVHDDYDNVDNHNDSTTESKKKKRTIIQLLYAKLPVFKKHIINLFFWRWK